MQSRVMIYEDNDALRSSLEELLMLTGEFMIAGSYENCLHADMEVKKGNPDIILMDIDMPAMSGIEAVKKIRQFNKQVPVIMLTVFDDNKNVFNAICAGASGYLLKKNVSEKLIAAIKEVQAGGAPMSPSIAKMVINSMQQHTKNTDYHFTVREKQVLALLCQGHSYKMISDATSLSFETIRTYIKRIYEKLQVHSATEAVSKAIQERLI